MCKSLSFESYHSEIKLLNIFYNVKNRLDTLTKNKKN